MNQLLVKMMVAGAVIVSLSGCGQQPSKAPEVNVQKEALPAPEAAPAPAATEAPAMQKSEATEPAVQEVASQDAPAAPAGQE